jgi:RimJ/RimL family protein N-acetyltransferase
VTLLRDVDDADLDVLFAHWTDAEANRMAAFTVADPFDRRAFDERWARLRADPTVLTKAVADEGVVLGTIGSWDSDGRREVTYWLGREHWGKGYATRALAEFLREAERTRPVYGVCAHDNAGSLRVLEKCGFRVVGEGSGFANARGEETRELILRLDA